MAGTTKLIMRIPVSIEANSRDELSRACLENNLRHQLEFEYFQIVKDGTKWVAWYYADVSRVKVLGKVSE